MKKKPEKCECGFCKLRDIEMDNAKREILYLDQRKLKVSKRFQERSKKLIELCVKNKIG